MEKFGAAVRPLARDPGAEIAELVGFGVLAGEHDQHAGQGFGRLDVDALDARRGMGRAQHVKMRLARQDDVVDIAAAPAQQLQILGARHRATEIEFTHGPGKPSKTGTEKARDPALSVLLLSRCRLV